MKASIITVITCTTVITGLTIDRSQPTNRRKSRIAYGERFDQECFPYVVGLKIALSNSHTNYCTGTLMSPLFVLTAAHCIVDSTSIEVYRNDPRNLTGEKRKVVKFFKHSLFNETNLVADLCLIKMNKPFKNITRYAIIPENSMFFTNDTILECFIVGWGKNNKDLPTNEANIASVRVKYGPDACKIPPDNYVVKSIVKRNWKEFLCAIPDSRMVCVGDSGGPLVCQGFLLGTASHGYYYYPEMGHLKTKCGDHRVQTRHIFVYQYRKWVHNIINGTSKIMKCNQLLLFLLIWLNFL